MSKKNQFPPALPGAKTLPLLRAAAKIAELAPWEFMSDMELIGLRDETTGELEVASVLGLSGTMFAVVVHRGEAGIRWIYEIATTLQPPKHGLEDMDALKVEWVAKREMEKPDSDMLAAAGFKPSGRGPVWPQFRSSRPGWLPWFISETEAEQLTIALLKVLRFIRLREHAGVFHPQRFSGLVPVVPAGAEINLQPTDLQWTALTPPLPRVHPPAALSPQDAGALSQLPLRKEFIFELMSELTPEIPVWHETARRPCFSRVALVTDRASGLIVNVHIDNGEAPLGDAAAPALVKALRTVKARPGAIHVEDERLMGVLGPACAAIGVPVFLVQELDVAPYALQELTANFPAPLSDRLQGRFP